MALFTSIGTALGATGAAATWLGAGVTAGAAGVGYSVFNQLNQPKPTSSAAQMPAAPAVPDMKDATAVAKQQAMERQKAAARSDSVMTNPLGIKDEAEVVRKKLLGS